MSGGRRPLGALCGLTLLQDQAVFAAGRAFADRLVARARLQIRPRPHIVKRAWRGVVKGACWSARRCALVHQAQRHAANVDRAADGQWVSDRANAGRNVMQHRCDLQGRRHIGMPVAMLVCLPACLPAVRACANRGIQRVPVAWWSSVATYRCPAHCACSPSRHLRCRPAGLYASTRAQV